MTKMRILAIGLLAVVAACAHESPDPPAAAPQAAAAAASVESGRHLAQIYCAGCHAIGETGESTHPMSPPFRELSRQYPVNSLEEAFAEGVLVGHPDMPEFRLEPEQIDDLLAYIQSIQERRGG